MKHLLDVLDGWEFFLPVMGRVFIGAVWSCLHRKGSGVTHELGFLFCLVWSQYASVCPSADTPVLGLGWGSPGLLWQVCKAPILLFNPYFFSIYCESPFSGPLLHSPFYFCFLAVSSNVFQRLLSNISIFVVKKTVLA